MKYWGSFRVEDRTIGGRTADERRRALYRAIADRSMSGWVETTSFLLFESSYSIDQIMAAARQAIAPSADVFLVRKLDHPTARVIGHVDDERLLKQFMPYLTRWFPPRTV